MSPSLYLLHFLCYSTGRARRDDDALKVVCISMMMMMPGECWLASRASNLITVITGGIQLALTGLSDPHHSYTRTITLVNIFVFLYLCFCILYNIRLVNPNNFQFGNEIFHKDIQPAA